MPPPLVTIAGPAGLVALPGADAEADGVCTGPVVASAGADLDRTWPTASAATGATASAASPATACRRPKRPGARWMPAFT